MAPLRLSMASMNVGRTSFSVCWHCQDPGHFLLWNFMYSLQGHLASLEYNSMPKISMLLGGIRRHLVVFGGIRYLGIPSTSQAKAKSETKTCRQSTSMSGTLFWCLHYSSIKIQGSVTAQPLWPIHLHHTWYSYHKSVNQSVSSVISQCPVFNYLLP